MKEKQVSYIELKFTPSWDYVLMGYSFISGFLFSAIKDSLNNESIAIAAMELLSNAVSYSSRKDLFLKIDVYKKRVAIEVINFSGSKNIERLKQEIAEVKQGTPREAYQKKCQDFKDASSGKPPLGFSRIRYEGSGEISYDIKNKRVHITVICPIERKQK